MRRWRLDLVPLQERLDAVWHAVQDVELSVALPDRPEPVTSGADEDNWLLGSGRDYLAQLAVYRARKAA